MAREILGQAFIRISPQTRDFSRELDRQLSPQIARVQSQLNRTFARGIPPATFAAIGATSAAAFSDSFGDRFAQASSGLFVPFREAAGKGAAGAATQLDRNLSPRMRDIGDKSGRVFGSAFGEGFAALAAFAVAARVARFFRETVGLATEFEQAFAGVQKTVEGTPEQFEKLERSILDLGTRSRDALPFAASEIARIAQVSGQLGVPITQIESFTDTVLRIGTATDFTAEQAAVAFARFAAVTRTPLTDIDRLGSTTVELGNNFATTESRILDFSRNIASLAPRLGLAAEDVLAFATAMSASGVRAESGSTAIQRSLDAMIAAANRGGPDLQAFLQITRLTVEEFQRLAAEDPAQLFIEFIRGLQGSGGDLRAILEEVGLGSQRLIRDIGSLTGAVDNLDRALVTARDAQEANVALNREFSIFAATNAQRLQILENRFAATRIEIGGKLAPAIVGLLGPISQLDTATVSLGAAFLGLAAGGFAFVRFSNIIFEFRRSLGGATVSATQFSQALRIMRAEGLSMAQVSRLAAQGQIQFTAATTAAEARVLTFRQALAAARAEGLGYAASLRAAATATGTFGRIASFAGKAAVAAFVVDLGTQGIQAIQNWIDELQRGTQNLEVTEAAVLKFARGIISIDEALSAARIGETIKEDIIGVGPRAITVFSSSIDSVLNKIPLLGRVIETDAEAAETALADLNAALLQILQTAGPELAQRLFAGFTERLQELGVNQREIDIGFREFIDALEGTQAGVEATAGSAEQAIASFVELGLSEEEARAAAEALGFQLDDLGGSLGGIVGAAEAASSAISGLFAAQSQYEQAVRSFLPSFGELVVDTEKSGRAASASARAARTSARQIADAQEAIVEAREDAARRIADAERRLADAEEDAIRRVFDARQRLSDARFSAGRRVRDAAEALQDFQAALARAGGARSPEDLIQLRELNQAVSDTRQDAQRESNDARRNLQRAEEDSADAIADARRRLAEAHREAAERIEDAQERLARAQEDAADRGARAAQRASDSIVRTTSALVASFRTNTAKLNTFAGLVENLAGRIFTVFEDQDIGEAFLGQLVDLGPDAIPLLRDLNKKSDKELAKLIGVFEKNVKAAKRAADLQFDRFPSNFERAIRPAVLAAAGELDDLIGAFDNTGDKGSEMAIGLGEDMIGIGAQIRAMADAGVLNLSEVETAFLNAGLSATDAEDRADNFRRFLDEFRRRDINITFGADLKPAQDAINDFFIKFNVDLEKRFGGQGFGFQTRQHGGPVTSGDPFLVGERGRELFIPKTSGTIISNRQTEQILNALKRLGGRGGTAQTINVFGVADDPVATARRVSWEIGQRSVR